MSDFTLPRIFNFGALSPLPPPQPSPPSLQTVSPQSCLTLCDPMDCNLPGSSVHGILQARVLECIAIPFSRGSSQLRN